MVPSLLEQNNIRLRSDDEQPFSIATNTPLEYFLIIFVASASEAYFCLRKSFLLKIKKTFWSQYTPLSTENILFCSFPCVCALFFVPSDAALASQFPRKYVRTMQPIPRVARIFWKIRLRLLSMPLTLHSHKQAFVMNVNGILNRYNLLFFKKNARFACVCAFFVVPLPADIINT